MVIRLQQANNELKTPANNAPDPTLPAIILIRVLGYFKPQKNLQPYATAGFDVTCFSLVDFQFSVYYHLFSRTQYHYSYNKIFF